MDFNTGLLVIGGVAVVVCIIVILKWKAEWVVNLLLRGVCGLLAIYVANTLLRDYWPEYAIGYNVITFVISAVLGFPGLLLLYGISLYMSL